MKELNFQVAISEKAVNVRTLSLDHAVMIWVGDTNQFNNLNVASINQDMNTTSCVDLLGTNSLTMSQKLCKKLKKQVLMSYNVLEDSIEPGLTEDLIMKGIIQNLTRV